MEENKKDFLILKTGWNEAVREVLNILDKKYSKYRNMYSVKQDIEKLLDTYDQNGKLDYPCEILKYYENNEELAREELNKVLSNFKKAED